MTEQEQERLIAALVDLEQRLPGGYQVALGLRLDQSIRAVERLFDEYDLPMRPELVAELTLWRSHAEDGVRLMERGYHLLGVVMQSVGKG